MEDGVGPLTVDQMLEIVEGHSGPASSKSEFMRAAKGLAGVVREMRKLLIQEHQILTSQHQLREKLRKTFDEALFNKTW